MKSILFSALALGAMTTIALAEPPRLASDQLDTITAGRRDESTVVYRGNSNNECTTCDANDSPPGFKQETTSLNPGNPSNTNCNNCGTTTTNRPGNN